MFRARDDFYVYLHKLHPVYTENGKRKGVTNEVAFGGSKEAVLSKEREVVYATHPIKYKGYTFHRDKDGFSLLLILWDGRGRELYGAYSPLQSLKQRDGSYLYTTGTAEAPASILFPQDPLRPMLSVRTTYHPPPEVDSVGEISFQVQPFFLVHHSSGQKLLEGKAAIGEKFRVGDYFLSVEEVRYWASMNVHYKPASMLIAASFWLGLGGITLSTAAKLAKRHRPQRAKQEENGN